MNVKKIFDLSDRVVVLTGAAGLLGTQYADGLSQAGANLVLADREFTKSKKLAKELERKYGNIVLPLKVDLANKKSVKNMALKTIKKFSHVDVLINNAMYRETKKDRTGSFEGFPVSSWNEAIAANITSMFLCAQEIGKFMVRQKHGIVINIGSIYGVVGADQRIYGKSGINSSVAYAVTKSAVLNFTRYLASYWHDKGIRVNTLSLGGVENKQDPYFIKNYSYRSMMGRMAEKDEYVGAILFLASDASSYMTGSNLIVDGGWTAW